MQALGWCRKRGTLEPGEDKSSHAKWLHGEGESRRKMRELGETPALGERTRHLSSPVPDHTSGLSANRFASAPQLPCL